MSRKRENLARKFLENCHENNLVGVTKSMSRGVDVNTVSEDGRWSGLTIAAEKNYPELLEMSHPDIEINNTTPSSAGWWTALMFACKRGNSAIVSRLVQNLYRCPGWTSTTGISWVRLQYTGLV